MSRIARWIVGGAFLVLGLGLSSSTAQAQGWDYGRQMFGFAQYYPGSGWSSYYHPDFDPQAFYPTTFGLRAGRQGTTFYAGPHRSFVPNAGTPESVVTPSPPLRTPNRPRLFGRRHARPPAFDGR